MDKSKLHPSPNWFQTSGMSVSIDGWVVYGGPSKSLCILVPLPDCNKEGIVEEPSYHAHLVRAAHPEKIVSVDICKDWPKKRAIVTGSSDGTVKQWLIQYDNNGITSKSTHTHEAHSCEKEDVVGVGYTTEKDVITVGGFGNIVKWDLASNVTHPYKQILQNFRPTCMSCSPHKEFLVAIGTKQGVIFLFDMTGQGKVLYKVRGHNEEIMNLSWCPKAVVEVKKAVADKPVVSINDRLNKIICDIENDAMNASSSSIKKNNDTTLELNESEIVEEEDLFGVYNDHADDEFGHKKYQPEEIFVKNKEDKTNQPDYLAECLKLKSTILNRKNVPEPTIESLVQALDKTNVTDEPTNETTEDDKRKAIDGGESTTANDEKIKVVNKEDEGKDVKDQKGINTAQNDKTNANDGAVPKSVHVQKQMLASIGKNGLVSIWAKSGKQVSSGQLWSASNRNKNTKFGYLTLLWYKPNVLLLSDNKEQLVVTNPLDIDCKSKLEWKVVHNIHKRAPYCISSGAPRLQTTDDNTDYPVWSVAQDRMLVQYSLLESRALTVHATCGGFVYSIANCPYDANKVGVSVGDGAVRVMEGSRTRSYWSNVQGKVLALDWHRTKENLLAFGTAEARVGLIDASGVADKPARVLPSVLTTNVYGLSWGEDSLYACAGGQLVRYQHNTNHPPEPVPVCLEGTPWQVCEVQWTPRALLVGSEKGGVALMTPRPPHVVVAAAFPFTKFIYFVDWHPQQVSSADTESPYKNWIAVNSQDKHIVILNVTKTEGGEIKVNTHSSLEGHTAAVVRVQWSPHRDARLLSTSQDSTVRVWSAEEGVCTHVFPGHKAPTLCATWHADPLLEDLVFSGGADCCVRLWDLNNYPASAYTAPIKPKRKTHKKHKEIEPKEDENVHHNQEDNVAASITKPPSRLNKKFLLPTVNRQLLANNLNACRKLLKKYLANKAQNGNNDEKSDVDEISKVSGESEDGKTKKDESKTGVDTAADNEEDYDCDYIKMFGSINEVNELLDMEQRVHESTDNTQAWLMLALFRGRLDDMMQYAVKKNYMCPFLLSLAPAVSFKYWKSCLDLYVAQIDRLCAEGNEEKLFENRRYGGAALRRAAMQLCAGEVGPAASTLAAARQVPAAHLMCRARHASELTRPLLYVWAQELHMSTKYASAAAIYIALDDLPEAASCLGKSKDEEFLSLAAEIAMAAGQTTYASQVAERSLRMKSTKEETLVDLPLKVDVMMGNLLLNDENISKVDSTVPHVDSSTTIQ